MAPRRPGWYRLLPHLDASSAPRYLRRRLHRALQLDVMTLRRRRRVATCLACFTGALAFFTLYVLSWVLVLNI